MGVGFMRFRIRIASFRADAARMVSGLRGKDILDTLKRQLFVGSGRPRVMSSHSVLAIVDSVTKVAIEMSSLSELENNLCTGGVLVLLFVCLAVVILEQWRLHMDLSERVTSGLL